MQEQFKITKVSNNIYKIQEVWFKEHANLYLFCGKNSNLLIDAGLGLFDIKLFLEKKGFKNVKVALTHSHFDHFGGIRHFSKNEVLITKKIYANLKNKNLFGLDFLLEKDFSSKSNFSEVKSIFHSFKIVLKPRNIKSIKVGNFNFKIIGAPGHTDDSVIYYDKKNGIIITGDTLYKGGIYFNFLNSNAKKFKDSLSVIKNLNFKLLLPGHGSALKKDSAQKIIKKWSHLCI